MRIEQEGRMWQKPGGRALRFTASERFAVDRVAFAWRARFGLLGPFALSVVDELDGGAGRLEARLFGLRFMSRSGPHTTSGEALRYLAELPWSPHAIAANPELEWRGLDERSAEVACRIGGERLAVTLSFDDAGDVVRASSEQRLFERGKEWVPTPWAGTFSEYAVLGGVRVPAAAEVAWELEEGPFVYWRGRVTSVTLHDEPF